MPDPEHHQVLRHLMEMHANTQPVPEPDHAHPGAEEVPRLIDLVPAQQPDPNRHIALIKQHPPLALPPVPEQQQAQVHHRYQKHAQTDHSTVVNERTIGHQFLKQLLERQHVHQLDHPEK